jgi:hypothetical protein
MSAHLVEWSFRFLLLVRVPVASPMDRVTFYLLDVPTTSSVGTNEQTSDGENFPRSCELAESPATAVLLYYGDDMMMTMTMTMMI